MEQCWNEAEDKRPSFSTVLGMIRGIGDGNVPSLVDSMIRRLEAHTRQLEEIVEERYYVLILDMLHTLRPFGGLNNVLVAAVYYSEYDCDVINTQLMMS